MKIEEIIGKTKLSEAMPILKIIAKENRLSLSRVKDFSTARNILIKKIQTIYAAQY